MRLLRYILATAVATLAVVPAASAHTLTDRTARAAVERHMTRNPPDTFEGERVTGQRAGRCRAVSRHVRRCYGEFAITLGRDRRPSEFCGGTWIAELRPRARRVLVVPTSGFEWDFSCYDRPRVRS